MLLLTHLFIVALVVCGDFVFRPCFVIKNLKLFGPRHVFSNNVVFSHV